MRQFLYLLFGAEFPSSIEHSQILLTFFSFGPTPDQPNENVRAVW